MTPTIPENVVSTARHEAAHAVAAERLGRGWFSLWVGAGPTEGNGVCDFWGCPGLDPVPAAATALAGIWQNSEPESAEVWLAFLDTDFHIMVWGDIRCGSEDADTLVALEALKLPRVESSHSLPPSLVEAAKLCHATMSTVKARKRVDTLAGALLEAWTPPGGGVVFAQPDGSVSSVSLTGTLQRLNLAGDHRVVAP